MNAHISPRLRKSALLREGICLSLFLALAAAVPAAASADAPFSAELHEQSAPVACPVGTSAGALCALATGNGRAPRFGPVAETSLGVIDLGQLSLATGCAPEHSTTTLSTSNGDQLFLTTSGAVCFKGKAVVDSGTYRVTGGTGRFAGAEGTGRYLTNAAFGANGAGVSDTTMKGSLELQVGASHGRRGDDGSDQD